jgi:hypothetical protein
MRKTTNGIVVFWLVLMTTGCDIHLPSSAEAALEEMAGEASVEEVVEAAMDIAEDGLFEFARCEQVCLKGAQCGSLLAGIQKDSCVAECTARGLAGDPEMAATLLCVEDAQSCEAVEACHEPGPDACAHGEISNRKGELCACIGGHWDCMVSPVEEEATGSEPSPVTVSDCAVVCDAVEACAADGSGACFAVCLNEIADQEIYDSVHCVLEAQSCEQVVNCAGHLSAQQGPVEETENACELGHEVMNEDGTVCACTKDGQWECMDTPADEHSEGSIDGSEASNEPPSCLESCNPIESCGFVPPGHCDQACGPDVKIPAQLVECLHETTHCEEVHFCLEEMEEQVEAEVSGECFPGEMSEDGCFCEQDSVRQETKQDPHSNGE